MAIDYFEHQPSDLASRQERAHRVREDGVEYKLKVIPGSGGQLELVEIHEPNLFLEWARLVQLTGWHT